MNGDGGDDWRSMVSVESRRRMVKEMTKSLMPLIPDSGPEALLAVESIAVRFEEKCYTSATSQCDYLRTISTKMLTLIGENQNQSTTADSSSIISDGNRTIPVNPEGSLKVKEIAERVETQIFTMDTESHNHSQNDNQARNANLMPSSSVGDTRAPQDPGIPTTLEEHLRVMATLSQVQASLANLKLYVEDRHSYVESQLVELRTRVDKLYSRADGYAAAPVHSHVGPSPATNDDL